MKNIAIIGWSFNPVHHGHLSVAHQVLEAGQLGIEQIVFLPTGKSPFKKNKFTTNDDRLCMLQKAVVSCKNFEISQIELNDEISYTIDSMRLLKKEYGAHTNLFFVIGEDLLENIYQWKEVQTLFKEVTFILVARKTAITNKQAILEQMKKDGAKIYSLQTKQMEISSSEIRYRVNNGLCINHLVPSSVESYIADKKLYKTSVSHVDIEQVHRILKENLSDEKYTHTLGVTETAMKLARCHHQSEAKAQVAGLFHDIVKQIGKEKTLQMIGKYHVKLDDVIMENIYLAHGPLAAVYASEEFGIYDEDILNAMIYHTTGRAGMSTLEKIIYVSDFIEPNRGENEILTQIREVVEKDLDKAVELTATAVINHLEKENKTIHPKGLEVLTDIKESNKWI